MKSNHWQTFQICIIVAMVLIIILSCNTKNAVIFSASSEDYKLKVEVEADSTKITMPFAMAFLPNGKMLLTNRTNGKIFQLDVASGEVTEINDVIAPSGIERT